MIGLYLSDGEPGPPVPAPSAWATASSNDMAAGSEKPPTNKKRRPSSRLSYSPSSPWLQSSVARIVRCLSDRSRPQAVESA